MQHTIKPEKRIDVRLVLGVLAVALLAVLAALFLIPRLSGVERAAAPDYWPTDGWRTTTPEAQGIDSTRLAETIAGWRAAGIPIHSLMLIRDGYVVSDVTFYPYDGQTVHDTASVTKSVMTTLIGIAVDQGHLSLDDTLVSFFPDYTIANLDARKEAITVRHLVSMSSGLECIRDGMPGETIAAMHASSDFVQFALDLPMADEPGSRFTYCSPAISLLSPILQRATGMPALEFAQQNLFAPLGIHDARWEQDPQGFYDGWGDLSLHPQDMAKFGLLFLQGGQWDGRQVISRDWVEQATAVQMTTPDNVEDPYGYGWWLSGDPAMEGVFRADGRLGQYIIALPDWNMLVVTTGGGFDIDQVGESLLATFADLDNPLPANPDGVAQLEAAVAALRQPPAAAPPAPLPDVARAISGHTYTFDPNPAELASIAFDFDGSAEAVAHLGTTAGGIVNVPVGLDGLYRFTPLPGDDRAVGFRGGWLDEQTFQIHYNGVTTNDQMVLRFLFNGDRVTVSAGETAEALGVTFEGQAE